MRLPGSAIDFGYFQPTNLRGVHSAEYLGMVRVFGLSDAAGEVCQLRRVGGSGFLAGAGGRVGGGVGVEVTGFEDGRMGEGLATKVRESVSGVCLAGYGRGWRDAFSLPGRRD